MVGVTFYFQMTSNNAKLCKLKKAIFDLNKVLQGSFRFNLFLHLNEFPRFLFSDEDTMGVLIHIITSPVTTKTLNIGCLVSEGTNRSTRTQSWSRRN